MPTEKKNAYFQIPEPKRFPGGLRVPRGLYATDKTEVANALRRANGVVELTQGKYDELVEAAAAAAGPQPTRPPRPSKAALKAIEESKLGTQKANADLRFLTKTQLREFLTETGVAFDPSSNKGDLIKLAESARKDVRRQAGLEAIEAEKKAQAEAKAAAEAEAKAKADEAAAKLKADAAAKAKAEAEAKAAQEKAAAEAKAEKATEKKAEADKASK